MFCAYCGEVNNSSDKFCKSCGRQIINMQQESPINDAVNAQPVNDLMGFNPDANSSNDDILMYSKIMKEGRVHEKDDPETQIIRQQEAEDIRQYEKDRRKLTKDSISLILSPYIFILAFYLTMFLGKVSGFLTLLVLIPDFILFLYYTIHHLYTFISSIRYRYFRFRYILVGLVFLVARLIVPIDNIFSIPLFTVIYSVVMILVTDWNKIALNEYSPKSEVMKLISVYAFYFTVFECGIMYMLFG